MTVSRILKISTGVTVVLMLVAAGYIGSILASPFGATQVRNALIAEVGTNSDMRWAPDSEPDGYMREAGEPTDEFVRVAEQLLGELDSATSNTNKALVIARHLASGPGVGDGIRSNTSNTYREILTGNEGYCSDFTQVFNAIAIAAGIPVREWGVSFGEFSGNGHAFNEVYDFTLEKWVMIDSFFSLYVLDSGTGQPLSGLEFHQALVADNDSAQITVVPIVTERFGFASPEAAIEYYRRGADHFFLWFGNNVFSYDQHAVVRLFGPVSRALEQGAAIVSGVHPEIRLLATADNQRDISALFRARSRFFAGAGALAALGILLIMQLLILRRGVRSDSW